MYPFDAQSKPTHSNWNHAAICNSVSIHSDIFLFFSNNTGHITVGFLLARRWLPTGFHRYDGYLYLFMWFDVLFVCSQTYNYMGGEYNIIVHMPVDSVKRATPYKDITLC